jgi:tRNA dimethylallyltransferase
MPDNLIESAINIIQSNPAEFAVILGPTCTGKTALALELAKIFQVPIINADSRLIFGEMNIGTAKPSQEERIRAKHFLIDIKDPRETYSAGEFQQDFDRVVAGLKPSTSNLKALVVGGTGLYIKSALDNLLIPPISPDPRLRDKLFKFDLTSLENQLHKLDPDAHKIIDMKNKIRIIRAIEIITQTGKPLKVSRQTASSPRYPSTYIGLNYLERSKLYELIDKRVLVMIEEGLVDEVKSLIEKYGPTQTLKATIGYKEIIDYLSGDLNLDEAISLIQKNTRNYAKRQLTWFRTQKHIHWLLKDPLLAQGMDP